MTNEECSLNTKMKIEQKFKETVGKKPLSKVTVSEIIEACGINRKTFYYHFEDKYSLLRHTLSHEAINIVKDIDITSNFGEAVAFIVRYIENNGTFLKNIYVSVGRDELKNIFFDDFANIVSNIFDDGLKEDEKGEFYTFLVKFYTEAIASTLTDMIRNYPNIERDKTVKYLETIIDNAKNIKYNPKTEY